MDIRDMNVKLVTIIEVYIISYGFTKHAFFCTLSSV